MSWNARESVSIMGAEMAMAMAMVMVAAKITVGWTDGTGGKQGRNQGGAGGNTAAAETTW